MTACGSDQSVRREVVGTRSCRLPRKGLVIPPYFGNFVCNSVPKHLEPLPTAARAAPLLCMGPLWVGSHEEVIRPHLIGRSLTGTRNAGLAPVSQLIFSSLLPAIRA